MADPFSFVANGSTTQKPQSTKNNAFDAFQDLVSFGANGPDKQSTGLTLAERAARVEQSRRPDLRKDNDPYVSISAPNSFWDKFDSSSTQALPRKAVPGSNEWDLDFLAPSSSNGNQVRIAPVEDPWDIDFISSESSKPKSQPASGNERINLLDSDDGSPLVDFTGSSQHSITLRSDTPVSFDFGDDHNNEDDILGDLGKPVEAVRNKAPRKAILDQTTHQLPSRNSHTPKKPPLLSPPPHVLGQLIEMGFSIRQSKEALSKTSNGVDVDAAIEILLRDAVNMPLEKPDSNSSSSEISRERLPPTLPTHPSKSLPSTSSEPAAVFQDQADKLLAHASSIGLNMFNKANALWREGREKVVKVYEEQRQGPSGEQIQTTARITPRWMDQTPGTHISTRPDAVEPDATAYKSPARRRIPRPKSPISSDVSGIISSSSHMPSEPVPLVSPPSPSPPMIVRPHIEAPASSLALSNAAKDKGTQYFKLGQFAEAESSYSRALESLPELHLSRVILHNNRALARIKTGQYKPSIEDSSMVIQIVTGDLGKSWHPSREPRDGTTLAHAVSKAYRRRAEAYEGLEKWKDAKTDWETLNSLPWVEHSSKKDVVNGITRCKRLLTGDVSIQHTPISSQTTVRTVKFQPTASVASIFSEGAALSRVRASNLVQEKEDQERHELKDAVDARLEAWRSGKERNIRALIASLEMILPARFRWQKVGMAELITNNQVKARYMKAIARLHPDKLSTGEISVEDRMVANGVFGTLNEAWNSFRQ